MNLPSTHWTVRLARFGGMGYNANTDLCTLVRKMAWGVLAGLAWGVGITLIVVLLGSALFVFIFQPLWLLYLWATAGGPFGPEIWAPASFIGFVLVVMAIRWAYLKFTRSERSKTAEIISTWTHSRLHRYCAPITIVPEKKDEL